MAQTPRAKMCLRCVLILVLLVVAESCDNEMYYKKDNKCCKMCEPGTMMKGSDCKNPVCQACAEGEFQDTYTNQSKCRLQPTCDPNLNLQTPTQSKTEMSPCLCKPEHHCSNKECNSCVKNTVCKAGEKQREAATQMEDTVCEPCPNGTFSNHESSSTCTPWNECSVDDKETVPGSSTSDRICEVQNKKLAIVIPIVCLLLLVIVGILGCIFIKGKKGSMAMQELQESPVVGIKHTHQPTEDNVHIETEQPPAPGNQPQEDTEDLLKPETLIPGVSENGMPVIQDHSKSSLLSESETAPRSFSDHL